MITLNRQKLNRFENFQTKEKFGPQHIQQILGVLTLELPSMSENSPKILNFILYNLEKQMLLKKFHLNGHIVGFCPQT